MPLQFCVNLIWFSLISVSNYIIYNVKHRRRIYFILLENVIVVYLEDYE